LGIWVIFMEQIKQLKQEDKKGIESLMEYAKNNKLDHFYRHPLDITGALQGFQHPLGRMDKVLGFDGSSFLGYQAIHESDMGSELLPASAIIDRTNGEPKLRILTSIYNPVDKKGYQRDPITIARRAVEHLKSTGIADAAYFGPEAEFFIFDHVEFDLGINRASYMIDSAEGSWNSGRNGMPNSGYRPGVKRGYSPAPPIDSLEDIRAEMMRELEFNGIAVETGHHEVATAGQGEIDLKYADLLTMAHSLTWFKHIVKNVTTKHGMTATFMPKPLDGDNGSGMHTHQSLWKGDQPLFAGEEYAGLSKMALHYIAGILEHAPALCAITNPTTNSYKRIVPHCEAPINLVYSARNRSAAIRIPQYEPGKPEATRIEVRFPDPMASSHLAFAAMLMAGLDGINRELNPGKPFEGNVYEHKGELKTLPGSLDEALNALEHDNEFLKKGGVFTDDFLQAWISLKRSETQKVRVKPVPIEFEMYLMA